MPVDPSSLLARPSALSVDPLPAITARQAALEVFAAFCASLRFRRRGDRGGPAKEFRVDIRDVHTEQPDQDVELKFPSIAVLPGDGLHEPFGLGPPTAIEETFGVYGAGTVLYLLSEYTEPLTVELWASTKPERLALVAGLEAALRSSDSGYAIGLKLPNYFDRTATFALDRGRNVDDPDIIRGRRRALLFVTLRVPEVQLGSATLFRPRADVEVRSSFETWPC